ncbi:MAG: flagellar basal body P-ring protein FlgI [Phycisphaerales bacterium]
MHSLATPHADAPSAAEARRALSRRPDPATIIEPKPVRKDRAPRDLEAFIEAPADAPSASRRRLADRPSRPIATLFALAIAALLALTPAGSPAEAATVRELARIQGEGRNTILGLGLVVGLPGTGDSGKEHPVARVVAEVLRNMGNPVADIDELARSNSAALVMVTCEIPAGGGREQDTFDVRVSVMHTATDISGGTLLIAPLRGPLPGQGVYAFASGEVVVEDAARSTIGIVRQGAQLVRDLVNEVRGPTFNLVLEPQFAGHASAAEIAGRINDSLRGRPDGEGPAIATPIDDRIIRIDIPEPERRNTTPFVADVLSTPIDLSTLRLPARVVVNERLGSIIVTGDVRVSPVRITHGDLTINVTVPPVEPTAQNPRVDTETWADLATRPRESQLARLEDLRGAFDRLRIPVRDQISIIHQLHRNGQLHAELIIDGA